MAEEIDSLILDLIDASFVAGEIMLVDGGWNTVEGSECRKHDGVVVQACLNHVFHVFVEQDNVFDCPHMGLKGAWLDPLIAIADGTACYESRTIRKLHVL